MEVKTIGKLEAKRYTSNSVKTDGKLISEIIYLHEQITAIQSTQHAELIPQLDTLKKSINEKLTSLINQIGHDKETRFNYHKYRILVKPYYIMETMEKFVEPNVTITINEYEKPHRNGIFASDSKPSTIFERRLFGCPEMNPISQTTYHIPTSIGLFRFKFTVNKLLAPVGLRIYNEKVLEHTMIINNSKRLLYGGIVEINSNIRFMADPVPWSFLVRILHIDGIQHVLIGYLTDELIFNRKNYSKRYYSKVRIVKTGQIECLRLLDHLLGYNIVNPAKVEKHIKEHYNDIYTDVTDVFYYLSGVSYES